MKTRILLLMAVALPGIRGVCHAQSPVQEVIDNALIQQTMSGNRDLLGVLQQQLTEAQKQTQTLTDQLSRMGNPAAVTMPSLELIKQDIDKSRASAESGGQAREERIRGTTGSEAFGDNAYGLVPGVGPSVKLKDDTIVQRDPEKYKLHAVMMEDLNNLAEKSTETDARIVQLEELRGPLLDQVSTAQDEATVLKCQVALQAIDAQIASSKADLIRSKQDYDILSEKLKLQEQIASRAKGEARDLESKHRTEAAAAARAEAAANAPPASGTGTGSTSPFSGLRWGRTTNTPSGTPTPP